MKSTRDYNSSASTITIAIKYKGKEYLIDGGDGASYPNGTNFLVKFACDDPDFHEIYTKRRIKGDSLNIPDEGWENKPYQF